MLYVSAFEGVGVAFCYGPVRLGASSPVCPGRGLRPKLAGPFHSLPMASTQDFLPLWGATRTVCPIDHASAVSFILAHHYSGRFPAGAMFRYGLIEPDGRLSGVCVFGSPASPWVSVSATGVRNKALELQRLALSENAPNDASWFVSRCLKLLVKEWEGVLVSYADSAAGHHGGVYQALGFCYAGVSAERTDIDAKGKHARHHNGDTSKRQFRSAKHRYWTTVGDPARYCCLWPMLPYPKPNKTPPPLAASPERP